MDEDVKRELESLKTMVVAWRESYEKLALEEGGNCMYLVKEYAAEIEEFVFPYVYKIMKLGGMEMDELESFMGFCQAQTRELHEALTDISEKEENDARKV